ncbi:MAG: hypothetical protein ACHQFX_11825 [Chitinophagales bacterium]
MKHFVAIIFLAPLWLSTRSQDCKVKKTTDPYTKEMKMSSGVIPLNGASLSIDADGKEIDFFFSMDGKEKCFSDAAAAVVIYEGTKMKVNFKNGGPMNCDGVFHLIFRNQVTTPTLLQRLITQKITSIQFTANNKSQITISFSPEEQQALMTRADCLIKEAKTLIK